jgi:hypothetical protein
MLLPTEANLDWQRSLDANKLAFKEGYSYFKAGFPIDKCPDFVLKEMTDQWRAGWEVAHIEKSLGKFEMWLKNTFPNIMKFFELRLKDEYR